MDVNLSLHPLPGPILYHRMMHTALPPDRPARIVDTFWKAHPSLE